MRSMLGLSGLTRGRCPPINWRTRRLTMLISTGVFGTRIDDIWRLTKGTSHDSRGVVTTWDGQGYHASMIAPKTAPRLQVPDAGEARNPVQDSVLSRLSGGDPRMDQLLERAARLVDKPVSIFLQGETGTGKEVLARALHDASRRAERPFVAVNCAAIPESLIESELFGYAPGTFTGARSKGMKGLIQRSDGGTLFLDEIGDMPLPLQTRLLRVLAEGEFFRVGGRELIRVDVRVIAATHQDLDGLVAEGRFRADLLHRLNVVRLQLPPLRERRADVPQLAENFLAMATRKLDIAPKRFSNPALDLLQAHDWPGNVRELENVCWRLAALAPADVINTTDLQGALSHAPIAGGRGEWDHALGEWARRRLLEGAESLHAEARERLDRTLLEVALELTHGRRAEAAAKLGVGRNTVTRKLGPGRKRG